MKTAIGASLATLAARAQDTPPPEKKLGWALVGLGSLSTHQIAPALLKTQHAKLAAVVTDTPEKGVKWRKQYGLTEDKVYSYENFDKIINELSVDVVYIVLPNSMHHEFTLRAARAGKHVFCEKPMANNVKDCQEMIAACSGSATAASSNHIIAKGSASPASRFSARSNTWTLALALPSATLNNGVCARI